MQIQRDDNPVLKPRPKFYSRKNSCYHRQTRQSFVTALKFVMYLCLQKRITSLKLHRRQESRFNLIYTCRLRLSQLTLSAC